MSERVRIQGPTGSIVYEDTLDHFENGVLRLLGFDREAFAHWIALAETETGDDVLAKLGRAFARLSPLAKTDTLHSADVKDGPGGTRGALWHPVIAENRDYGVARSLDNSLGWLIRLEGDSWRRVVDPPRYEEAYFEGGRAQAGGYGNYGAQGDWRLEKAARQVRELGEATGVTSGRVLDLGSGYGYFRKALADAGFEHDGVEPSAHAREAARERFGFETRAEIAPDWQQRFDVATLWDVIEHVPEPADLLARVAACLAPRGILALKTPNLRCPEARVFGPHYHSLKREHLVYFTAPSLVAVAFRAGFESIGVTSVSHLLSGFVGAARTAELAGQLEGADLVAYFRKTA